MTIRAMARYKGSIKDIPVKLQEEYANTDPAEEFMWFSRHIQKTMEAMYESGKLCSGTDINLVRCKGIKNKLLGEAIYAEAELSVSVKYPTATLQLLKEELEKDLVVKEKLPMNVEVCIWI